MKFNRYPKTITLPTSETPPTIRGKSMIPTHNWIEYGIDSWRGGLGALTVIIVKVDNRYVVRSQWYPFIESVSHDLPHAKLSGERMIYLEVTKMSQQLGIIE